MRKVRFTTRVGVGVRVRVRVRVMGIKGSLLYSSEGFRIVCIVDSHYCIRILKNVLLPFRPYATIPNRKPKRSH